jgi:hypothetical protein
LVESECHSIYKTKEQKLNTLNSLLLYDYSMIQTNSKESLLASRLSFDLKQSDFIMTHSMHAFNINELINVLLKIEKFD